MVECTDCFARARRENRRDVTIQFQPGGNQMTYKEFKRHVFTIYNETFDGTENSPIDYGIQRAKFEEKKLNRLIVLADQTDFSTAKRKVAGWRRQLERVQQIKARLERRKSEMPVPVALYDRPEYAVTMDLARVRNGRSVTVARAVR